MFDSNVLFYLHGKLQTSFSSSISHNTPPSHAPKFIHFAFYLYFLFFFLPNSSLRLRAVIKSPGDASGVTNITISICAPGSEQASWQRRKLLVGKGLRESGVSIGVTDEVAKEGL